MLKKVGLLFSVSMFVFTLLAFGNYLIHYEENEVAQVTNMKEIYNWGLSFKEEGKKPMIDVEETLLKQYDAYYVGDEENKKIYLTFDAGYENGYTSSILDVLKEQQVKAAFFVVGNYIEKSPDLVKRMVEEGHIVANHTYHHKDMATLSNKEDFLKELGDLETLYESVVGSKMPKYYRPPQGKFTTNQLIWAKEAGYKTCFWSLAYVDWDPEKQPTREEAIEKLSTRIHPGSIVLLHSTSETNALILEDMIKQWKSMGYEIDTLDNL